MNKNAALANLVHELSSLAEDLRVVQLKLERSITLITDRADRAATPSRRLDDWLFLHKDELPALILASFAGRATNQSRPGCLHVDIDGRCASVGDLAIRLSKNEFKLLELLWKESPRAVSRPMIMDHVYAEKEKPTRQVADVYICRLRQKLRAANCMDADISTVWGQGWRLESPLLTRPLSSSQLDAVP